MESLNGLSCLIFVADEQLISSIKNRKHPHDQKLNKSNNYNVYSFILRKLGVETDIRAAFDTRHNISSVPRKLLDNGKYSGGGSSGGKNRSALDFR